MFYKILVKTTTKIIFFSVNPFLQAVLVTSPYYWAQWFQWFLCFQGGLARLVAVTVVNPLELVRTKMQAQKMPLYQV